MGCWRRQKRLAYRSACLKPPSTQFRFLPPRSRADVEQVLARAAALFDRSNLRKARKLSRTADERGAIAFGASHDRRFAPAFSRGRICSLESCRRRAFNAQNPTNLIAFNLATKPRASRFLTCARCGAGLINRSKSGRNTANFSSACDICAQHCRRPGFLDRYQIAHRRER